MPLVETEAIILKSYNLAEADRIVVFLSRHEGVVRGVAKGAKRLKSKFGSSLEPFSIVKIEYFIKESSELVAIQKVELTRSSFAAASDPEFLQVFSYLAEILIIFSPPHDPNETLYRMVTACIESGANSRDGLAAIAVYFETWLMRLSGFLPDWSSCDACGRKLDDLEGSFFLPEMHIRCANCHKNSRGDIFEAETRAIVAAARRLSPADFVVFTFDQQSRVTYLSQIMRRLISRSAGREIVLEQSFAVKI